MAVERKRRGRPPLGVDQNPTPRIPIATTVVSRPEPSGVRDGDIYKHYAEKDVYCVLITDDKNIKYAELTGTPSWQKFKELNHEVMIRSSKTMTLANANAIVKEGSWIFVENIVKLWGG